MYLNTFYKSPYRNIGKKLMMKYDSWLAGLWDGDGSRYILRRKSRSRQVDYFVKISTSSFLGIWNLIIVFEKIFGFKPYNTRALLRKNRKHYVFEIRCDSKHLFEWFENENLHRLISKSPLDYISGFFWAEGSIFVKSKGSAIGSHSIILNVRPDNVKRRPGKYHLGTANRVIYALNSIEDNNKTYKSYVVYECKSGKNKGQLTIKIRDYDLAKYIIESLPFNWKIFKWLYIEGDINVLTYLFAYTLDYSTFNKLLGILLMNRNCTFSLFDKWFIENVLEVRGNCRKYFYDMLKDVSSKTEIVLELFHILGIKDYRGVLKYSEVAREEFLSMSKYDKSKVIESILNSIYMTSAKFFRRRLSASTLKNSD